MAAIELAMTGEDASIANEAWREFEADACSSDDEGVGGLDRPRAPESRAAVRSPMESALPAHKSAPRRAAPWLDSVALDGRLLSLSWEWTEASPTVVHGFPLASARRRW